MRAGSCDARVLVDVCHLAYPAQRLQLWRREELVRHACELINRPLTIEEWAEYLPEDAYAGNRACPQFRLRQGK
jgi:hypothetical protein